MNAATGFAKSEEHLPRINWLALVGPTFAGGILVLVILFFSVDLLTRYIAAFVISLVGGGKFTILFALKEDFLALSPYQIMLPVMYIEFSQGIMFLYNVDLFRRIKKIRKYLDMLRLAADRMFEKWPTMRKLAFGTLIIFVALPFQGTGAIGGVVFSSVLGMRLFKTLIGIFIGSIMGNMILAVGVDIFQEKFVEFAKDPLVLVTFIVILIGCIWAITILMVKTMKELAEEAKKQKAITAVAGAVRIHSFNIKKIDIRILLDDKLISAD